VERRRRHASRPDPGRVDPLAAVAASPSAAPAPTPSELTHLTAIVDGGGQIMLGSIAPIRGAAVAHDGKKTVAMLRRRPGEPIPTLLARLDAAVATARASGQRVGEINPRGSDRRYQL